MPPQAHKDMSDLLIPDDASVIDAPPIYSPRDLEPTLPSYANASTGDQPTSKGAETKDKYRGEFDEANQRRELESIQNESDKDVRLSEDEVKVLSRYDMVIVVDDSTSMTMPIVRREPGTWEQGKTRWTVAGEAIAQVAAQAVKYDSDGIDVVFLNASWHDTQGIKTAADVKDLFGRVKPTSGTPTGRKLDSLFQAYERKLDSKNLPPKKINYLVITDGAATDKPLLRKTLVQHANHLEARRLDQDHVGVQFVQIGDSPNATEFLQELDDELSYKPEGAWTKISPKRDIVDTTKYKTGAQLTGLRLFKILLGGINKRQDWKRLD